MKVMFDESEERRPVIPVKEIKRKIKSNQIAIQ
jgi:hypothetical protein